MKLFLSIIAALAINTMFVQASEDASMQEAMAKATQAIQEATDVVPSAEEDKNATENKTLVE